jgi:hypothetical protein
MGTPENNAPLMDKDGNYIIKVNTAMAPRSITAAQASHYAEEYEIVCRNTVSGAYYSGYARGTNLTVSLPEGNYNMLLLAGNGNRVLLGTGWEGAQVIGPDTGSVTITVKPLTILDTKMVFDDNQVPASDSINTSGTPPLFEVDPGSTKLTTTFVLDNMDALVAAGVQGGVSDIYDPSDDGFVVQDVVLKYYDDDHLNQLVNTTLTTAPIVTGTETTLTFPDLNYIGSTADWSAAVYLDLQYIPFSQTSPPANSRTWYIMNGTGQKLSNGAVKVKAGDGGKFTLSVYGNL